MSKYVLGVDLGTTFTAAAVCELGASPRMLSLGSQGYAVPSVWFARDDRTMLVGEAAELRSHSDPIRVARFVKRRLGDDTPIVIAGAPHTPESLLAALLRWVVDQATERMGTPPASVVMTHPANWGRYRRDLLARIAIEAQVGDFQLLPEPQAAAICYALSVPLQLGETFGVYDLGGGTFDAVVMRRIAEGFELAGQPSGVEHLGGADFDKLILGFVMAAAGIDQLELSDDALAGGHLLQSSCIDAKRLLSVDTSADIRVVLPGANTTVRITRSEFEELIRPALRQTLTAFRTAVDSADVGMEDLSRILLVGGSSRIPLVSALLIQEFGRPLAVDADPKNTVSLGAALYGASNIEPDLPILPRAEAETHRLEPEIAPMSPPGARSPERPSPVARGRGTEPTAPAFPRRPTPAPPRTLPPAERSAAPEPATTGAIRESADHPSPDELLGVQAQSVYRVRIPVPVPPRPTVGDDRGPAEGPSTEAVDRSPALLVTALALLVVLAAAGAYILTLG